MTKRLYAGTVEALKQDGPKVVTGEKQTIAVFYADGTVYAVNNRCPHMGFPLHMGSLCDGLLTCHWHHARFDIASGGTLDPWADDVATYAVTVQGGDVWVDPTPRQGAAVSRYRQRLREGLEQNLSLVIAKAVVGLVEAGEPPEAIAQIGIDYGTTYRKHGWRSGLTILTAMVNVLPKLDKMGRILALFHGLVHVARESVGGTRFMLEPLPNDDISLERLARWYRRLIEVRDTDGAERVLLTAIRCGATTEQLADMMMAAVTDHFYMDGGHALDFHNKAFEILAHVDSDRRARVLTSLVPELSSASRSEEMHNWQAPVDLVQPLERAFARLPDVADLTAVTGATTTGTGATATGTTVTDAAAIDTPMKLTSAHAMDMEAEEALVDQILSDDPQKTIEELLTALEGGMSPVRLAQLVVLAAAERIARFNLQNDFNDWDTVLHTFTHAHAVHESLLRSVSLETVRGVFHAAMTVYLDRFLNVPPARLPRAFTSQYVETSAASTESAASATPASPAPSSTSLATSKAAASPISASTSTASTTSTRATVLAPERLLELLDKQQQVSEAAEWVAHYLVAGGDKAALFNVLGHALLREDAAFHTFQMFEAAVVEHDRWASEQSALAEHAQCTLIVAATRYIAAHAPTARDLPHTASIAWRLSRGEKLFAEE